jgi:hypothetical protein
MIDFTRAFSSAWERMEIILFRPFDFGKWCAIGLSAFLAGLLQGGNGVNFNGNFNNQDFGNFGGNKTQTFDFHQFSSAIGQYFSSMQTGIIILIAILVVILFLGLTVLLYWLGAHGQFMFLDNVVRNRGAVVWPWHFYARQAVSVMLLYLLLMVVILAMILPIVVGVVVVCIPLFQQTRWPHGGEIVILAVLALLYLAVALVMAVIMFVFREFGIALMFRQGILARPAFWQSMRLIGRFPGSIALFVLLRFAIAIAVAILAILICCVTCCIGALPYVGTVVLLPALIYVKCFTLDCLAQFGPECDVWTVDVAPVSPLQQPG